MPYHVYILVNEADPSRHYTGRTALDPDARLRQHNTGQVPHTSKYKPWRIETYASFIDEQKAIRFEGYLKSGSGREFARRHL